MTHEPPTVDAEVPFLEAPCDGVPALTDTRDGLDRLIEALAEGTGPVAFDAERAHGHRYFPKAYLFQLRRAGVGSALIDPIAFERHGRTDLGAVCAAVGDAEWIVHSASQDLPCMIDDGIVPARLFDTELAAKLLNYPAVGLAALVERHCGLRLRKAHSADNWSKRPLPHSWLVYATLDVELLLELRDMLADELASAGKTEWAAQEFEHVLAVAQRPSEPEADRWRRTSGLRDVRTRRGLAVARALWLERDRISRDLDRPPGRLLPDSGIVAVAVRVGDAGPLPGAFELASIVEFGYRGARRFSTNWARAIASVDRLSPAQYPPKRLRDDEPGHPRAWARNYPEAAERWDATRPAVDAVAEELNVPPAVLVQPVVLRDVVFTPPPADGIESRLHELGARPWQIDAITPVLRQTLAD